MTHATYFTDQSSGIKIADIWHPTISLFYLVSPHIDCRVNLISEIARCFSSKVSLPSCGEYLGPHCGNFMNYIGPYACKSGQCRLAGEASIRKRGRGPATSWPLIKIEILLANYPPYTNLMTWKLRYEPCHVMLPLLRGWATPTGE